MLDHQASILDDVDTVLRERARERLVPDATLQPHDLGWILHDVRQVRSKIFWSPEDVEDVERAWHVRHTAHDRPAEDLPYLGEVDGNWDDLEPRVVQILGHIEGRLARLLLGLDAQHPDA